MEDIIFRAKKISKCYRKAYALKDFDMEIQRGAIYGFIGRNGAGKTTLMRILAGRVIPTSGEMELFGENTPKRINQQRIRINGIVEKPAFYPNMTAQDNLEICRLQRGILEKKSIEQALEMVKLPDTGAKKAKHFSLGMKQRLGLAMALLGNTEFLFLDEPTNGLDPVGIIELRDILQRLNQERGITILISSHLLTELHQLATCYGFIHSGKMLEQITAEELKERCGKFLSLKADDVKKIEKILRAAYPAGKFKIVSADTIYFYDPPKQHGEVMQILVSEGISVEEMALKSKKLEDYFRELIGGNSDE